MTQRPTKHSALGKASCFVGGAMLLVQFGIMAAVALGVRDNQGHVYAFWIPLFMYALGVPVGLLLALGGAVQDPKSTKLGTRLTLVGPLVFILYVLITLASR